MNAGDSEKGFERCFQRILQWEKNKTKQLQENRGSGLLITVRTWYSLFILWDKNSDKL